MKAKTVYISIGVSLLVIGLLTWFIGWYLPSKKEPILADTDTQDKDTSTIVGLNSTGAIVMRLQRYLNTYRANHLRMYELTKNDAAMQGIYKIDDVHSEPLVVDGIFGKKTLLALQLILNKDSISEKELITLERKLL